VNKAQPQPGFLPFSEAATKLGKNKVTLYRWAEEGKVVFKKIGSHYYVETASLVNHIGLDEARRTGIVQTPSQPEEV
jgi:nucleoid-associated protein YejK